MALTQTDLDTLKTALATGYLNVRFSDGRSVTYRSVKELREAMTIVQADIDETAGTRVRMVKPYTSPGH